MDALRVCGLYISLVTLPLISKTIPVTSHLIFDLQNHIIRQKLDISG